MASLLLQRAFLPDLPPDLETWTRGALTSRSLDACRKAFTHCESIFGDIDWSPSAAARDVMERNRLEWLIPEATAASMTRVLLLLHAAELTSALRDHAIEWYVGGDTNERRAIARSLSLMPRPKEWTEIATLAIASTNVSVFAAMCLDNPYPSAFLDDETYEVMIARAMDVDRTWPRRILGLGDRARLNAEMHEGELPPSVRAWRQISQ